MASRESMPPTCRLPLHPKPPRLKRRLLRRPTTHFGASLERRPHLLTLSLVNRSLPTGCRQMIRVSSSAALPPLQSWLCVPLIAPLKPSSITTPLEPARPVSGCDSTTRLPCCPD